MHHSSWAVSITSRSKLTVSPMNDSFTVTSTPVIASSSQIHRGASGPAALYATTAAANSGWDSRTTFSPPDFVACRAVSNFRHRSPR